MARQLQTPTEGIKRLYSSGDYADLVISCKGQEWKVHKFWLCAQSSFFQNVCSGKFKEATENRIALDDDDPEVVEAFIHCLYNFDYDDYTSKQTSGTAIMLDVRMFVIADKYFVPTVEDLATAKFTERAKVEWNTPGFADAAAEVYRSDATKEGNPLKQTIINTVKTHAKELLNPAKGYKYFFNVLGETPRFGADVSRALASQIPGKRFKCPDCNSVFTANDWDGGKFCCPLDCYCGDLKFWSKYEVKM